MGKSGLFLLGQVAGFSHRHVALQSHLVTKEQDSIMAQDYSIETDLNEAEAMVKGFVNYLKSNEVYGSVAGGFFGFGQMPSLTTGALAMRLRRLAVLRAQLDDGQQARLDAARLSAQLAGDASSFVALPGADPAQVNFRSDGLLGRNHA